MKSCPVFNKNYRVMNITTKQLKSNTKYYGPEFNLKLQ